MNHYPSSDRYAINAPRVSVRRYCDDWSPDHAAIREAGISFKVTGDSKAVLKRAVLHCAAYFRREFHYDFVQYGMEDEGDGNQAFLWCSDDYDRRGIGACCFRWREYTNHPHGWALQWIWFHPYFRRHGHLRKAWPYFRQAFGDFAVEGPISPAMEAFLAAVDPKAVPDHPWARAGEGL